MKNLSKNSLLTQKRKQFFFSHWKLGSHLIFRTNYFGTNNFSKSNFKSLWGKSLLKIVLDILMVFPIIYNIKILQWRISKNVGFIPDQNQ